MIAEEALSILCCSCATIEIFFLNVNYLKFKLEQLLNSLEIKIRVRYQDIQELYLLQVGKLLLIFLNDSLDKESISRINSATLSA